MTISPVSKFQEQFWYINKLAPRSAAYNIPLVFKLDSLPKIDKLEQALNIILERHEILRSHYKWQDFSIVQIINPVDDCKVSVRYLNINKNQSDLSIPQELLEEINRPFKLDIPPLLRVKIFQFKNIIYLSFIFHHIVIDIHSKTIFESELTEIYNSLQNQKTPCLNTNYRQYKDYCLFSNNWLKSKEALALQEEWLKELPSVGSLLNLPTDYQRPRINTLEGNRLNFELSEILSAKVKDIAIKAVTTDFVFLLSCYAVLLFRLSKQNKIIIGVPLSNRRQKEYKSTFGVFVNALPIYINFSDLNNFTEVIKQVRQKLLFAHRKQEIPFISILQNSGERNLSYNPFFQTGFTFEPRMNLDLEGVIAKPMQVERNGSQLDLFLTIWKERNQYKGFWEYSGNLFKRSSIVRFHQQFLIICSEANRELHNNNGKKNIHPKQD